MSNHNDFFARMKAQYHDTPIPDELAPRVAAALHAAQTTTRRQHRHTFAQVRNWVAAAATLCLVFTGSLHASPSFAEAMGQVPLLGSLVTVLTGQTYTYDNAHQHVALEAPQVTAGLDAAATESINTVAATRTASDYAAIIAEINAHTDTPISANSGYNVLTDTPRLFALEQWSETTQASTDQTATYIVYDKEKQQLLTLPTIFRPDSDYIAILSAEIIRQMQTQMAANPDLDYWIAGCDIPEANQFQAITPAQNFYLTATGEVVITFDKYDVAPGSMGRLSFTIPPAVTRPLLADPTLVP